MTRLPRPLFGPAGPQTHDIAERAWAADCHFVASVQALTLRDPRQVSEFFEITPNSVHVTCYPSSSGPNNARLTARVAVARPERPAKTREADWVSCLREAFEATEGFSSEWRQRDSSATLRWLTGHALTLNLSGGVRTGVEMAYIVRRFRAGDAVVLGTMVHAYVVTAVESKRIQIRDTHGESSRWLNQNDAWGFVYRNVTVSARPPRERQATP